MYVPKSAYADCLINAYGVVSYTENSHSLRLANESHYTQRLSLVSLEKLSLRKAPVFHHVKRIQAENAILP